MSTDDFFERRVIATKSTSPITQDILPIILKTTETTRLIFCPKWVSLEKTDNPLRGGFHHQRKGKDGNWQDIPAKPLTTLKKDESYTLNLDGEAMSKFIDNIPQIRDAMIDSGHYFGTRIISLSEDNVNQVVLDLADVEKRDMVVESLRQLEQDKFENLEVYLSKIRINKVIQEFEENLNNSDERFWQDFFERNSDVFSQVFPHTVTYLQGETYVGGKNTRGRNGQGGVASDFLFQHGSNGSFGVVEIKTPMTSIMSNTEYRGQKDGMTNHTYSCSQDLSGALVQVEGQIQTAIQDFTSQLDPDFREENLSRLNPFGLLVIGCYSNLSEDQKRSFDLFRKSVRVQILTFDEILEKIKSINRLYE